MIFYIVLLIILIIYILFNNIESFIPDNKNDKDNSNSYNLKNIFTTRYHEKSDDIIKKNPFLNKVYYFNTETQQIEHIPRTEYKSYTTYNPPNTFKYGPETYVPSYSDSVHLSLNTPTPKPNHIYKDWDKTKFSTDKTTINDITLLFKNIINTNLSILQKKLKNTLDYLKSENN